jgi:biopolymer transport protein ExbB/TolQ
MKQCLMLENDSKLLNEELMTVMGGWELDRKELNKVKTLKEEIESRALALNEEVHKQRNAMNERSKTLAGTCDTAERY